MKAIRWSDNDKYFGPLTYSKGKRGSWSLQLGSGDDDDYRGCRLLVTIHKATVILALPGWVLKPHKKWVDTSRHEWSGVNGGYWDVNERCYGFNYTERALHIYYGEQTNSWPGSKSKCYFIPWMEWRHVRTSHYGLQGEHFYTEVKGDSWEANREKVDQCPNLSFDFFDYDGERITAKCRIDEREWHRGTWYFKWLSLFCPPKISRSLDIQFSSEVGKRKGSWKGGTLGHGIEMKPGELHEQAFRRYCDENELKFIGVAA